MNLAASQHEVGLRSSPPYERGVADTSSFDVADGGGSLSNPHLVEFYPSIRDRHSRLAFVEHNAFPGQR